ncbi:hypothetical protein HanIR_Chr07g0334471 [Helianthus annuus]|nr:hypothetical protein HanIR_Chr07g0334471 [Helianthus annuus]
MRRRRNWLHKMSFHVFLQTTLKHTLDPHPLALIVCGFSQSCVCFCNNWFYDKNLWIYKCEKCICYVHLDCATSSGEPFMSILSIGRGQTIKNFDDVDYPDLLHLPFHDLTYSIPKHLFSKEIGPTTYGTAEVSMQHINHQHDLILVNTESIGSTSSKINDLSICHNPMKKTQLLCNGCVRPIMEMSFYTCRANEDEKCNFALHVWCIRLPTKVENHPGHAQYTLVLMSNGSRVSFNTFYCRVFYHCDMCSHSMHSICVPLICQCETEIYSHSHYRKGIFLFLNVKFGTIYKIDGHPHPIMCLECQFTIPHNCFKSSNNS